MRNVISFEESYKRVQSTAKQIDDKTKCELLFRIIRKAFVSLLESIILDDVTPMALHPNPISVVNDCLPWALALRKKLSILNATRGRYPKSSSMVKSGKKIAIGGSITDTTQLTVL